MEDLRVLSKYNILAISNPLRTDLRRCRRRRRRLPLRERRQVNRISCEARETHRKVVPRARSEIRPWIRSSLRRRHRARSLVLLGS